MTHDDLLLLVTNASGGVPEIDAQPLLEIPLGERPLLLDIRPAVEREAEGAIPHTRSVPLDVLAIEVDDALADAGIEDRNTPFVCYCRRGNRSKTAVLLLRELGWPNAVSLRGGIQGWSGAGGKLV